jgi:Arc/MetJ family transcription regulator
MKITMNIDDALLERVMAAHGITSKTKAVDFALRELDRRSELKRLLSTSMGFTDHEIVSAFDTSYDLPALRVAENPAVYGKGAAAAATAADNDPSGSVKYAKKPRTRR